MKATKRLKSLNKYELLLIFSFILIFIKGLEYLIIGIIYPLIIALALLSPFVYCYFNPNNSFRKTIKYWSILVLCYGLFRISLNITIHIAPKGIPSAAYYQFTFWYICKSVLYVVLGIILIIRRKYMFTDSRPINIRK